MPKKSGNEKKGAEQKIEIEKEQKKSSMVGIKKKGQERRKRYVLCVCERVCDMFDKGLVTRKTTLRILAMTGFDGMANELDRREFDYNFEKGVYNLEWRNV